MKVKYLELLNNSKRLKYQKTLSASSFHWVIDGWMEKSMHLLLDIIELIGYYTLILLPWTSAVIQKKFTNNQKVSSSFFKYSYLQLFWFIDGQFYFIKGWHLREFGFPRENDLRKVFKWKKMNFTTDLPK